MTATVLFRTDFKSASPAWVWPQEGLPPGLVLTGEGSVLSAPPDQTASLAGFGVHTRNGDSIELRFRALRAGGSLRFGFDAEGHEHARVAVDFAAGIVAFVTSDWRQPQPVATVARALADGKSHALRIEKTEGGGNLVKMANVAVFVDGERALSLENQDLLPEMGVKIGVKSAEVVLEEFVHLGAPSSVPEYLHLGGWQVLNDDSIELNLDSIKRGISIAAEEGVQLLVTTEASLTGLWTDSPRFNEPEPIAEAEAELQRYIARVPHAPYVIVGMPVWKAVPGHGHARTKFVGSKLYDPDGALVHTSLKVHSAEDGAWHGYRLNEFDVFGVPCTLHICHDHRYPELQTLPVMFGTRLVIHPSNGAFATGPVEALEAVAKYRTAQTHAFYINVNANGGSYIVDPRTSDNFLVAGPDSTRDNPAFPMIDKPTEGFFQANIRVHDAFGYWPMRSFRASEEIAQGYFELYRRLGGTRG